MSSELEAKRIDKIVAYFRKVNEVDAGDPDLLEFFTDDVQFYFPKYGTTRGKDAVVTFDERIGRELKSVRQDIDGFNYIAAGDHVVVEGTESGVTWSGISWPDGTISQGRFCSVFEFDGLLIRRLHIYVDPDFTNADLDRLRIYRGEEVSGRAWRTVAGDGRVLR